MKQKILEDIQLIKHILGSQQSLKEKYFQIKSLEMYLLEYQVIEGHRQQQIGHSITNAAEFIHNYFLIKNIWNEFENHENFIVYTLSTLERILASNRKDLDEIPEFRLYEKYYRKLHEALVAV